MGATKRGNTIPRTTDPWDTAREVLDLKLCVQNDNEEAFSEK